jgi:hypothetical protein
MREYHLNTFRESRGESADAESHRKRRVQLGAIQKTTESMCPAPLGGAIELPVRPFHRRAGGKGDTKRRQRAARCNPGEGFRLVRAAGLASA